MPRRIGTIVPEFSLPSLERPAFYFNSVAGRPILLAFLDDAQPLLSQALVAQLLQSRERLDDRFASLFLVCRSAAHAHAIGVTQHSRGLRVLIDGEQAFAQHLDLRLHAEQPPCYPGLVLLDRHLRVLNTWLGADCLPALPQIWLQLEQYHASRERSPHLGMAPVIVIDRIFEPALCQALIDYYRQQGGDPSGVMRDVQGRTKGFLDNSFKKRLDCTIAEEPLREAARQAIAWRIRPLIRQAFAFDATRIERDIIACYDSVQGGFFLPHRDNRSAATKHRRFAVSVNLNAEEHEGGDLYFPEYGDRTYRAPTGGAVVFSGSLLHGVTPVVKGTRFAYLPFLFGENEVALREDGMSKLDPEMVTVG